MTKLLVGLGNPGRKYTNTRHNLGFIIIDALANLWRVSPFRSKFKGEYAEHYLDCGEKVVLLKPQTFMNLSGESVQAWVNFLKINKSDLLVIHDELDLPFGRFKAQYSAGAAGNRGIQSIIQHLGHKEFCRLRLGIGRPPQGYDVSSYVLAKFSLEEEEIVEKITEKSIEAIDCYFKKGVDSMLQMVNSAAFQLL
ncbi:MAG: aminoacyl-tRNA hydrolase [Deltaproteobacteria bacterium]|nr:aminoacyl-tRNA hydrolase [Deltaproteobacteria bacterium]